jgi:hypothetical protein
VLDAGVEGWHPVIVPFRCASLEGRNSFDKGPPPWIDYGEQAKAALNQARTVDPRRTVQLDAWLEAERLARIKERKLDARIEGEPDPGNEPFRRSSWPETPRATFAPTILGTAGCNEVSAPRESWRDDLAIAMFPCGDHSEVVARASYLGDNGRLTPEIAYLAARRWGERWGAVIVAMAHGTLEFSVSRPPTTREDAYRLAQEHFLFCWDLGAEPGPTLDEVAAGLLASPFWSFWWD